MTLGKTYLSSVIFSFNFVQLTKMFYFVFHWRPIFWHLSYRLRQLPYLLWIVTIFIRKNTLRNFSCKCTDLFIVCRKWLQNFSFWIIIIIIIIRKSAFSVRLTHVISARPKKGPGRSHVRDVLLLCTRQTLLQNPGIMRPCCDWFARGGGPPLPAPPSTPLPLAMCRTRRGFAFIAFSSIFFRYRRRRLWFAINSERRDWWDLWSRARVWNKTTEVEEREQLGP